MRESGTWLLCLSNGHPPTGGAREPRTSTPPRPGTSHTLAVTSTAQDRALANFAVYLRVEKGLAPLTVSSYGGDLKLWAEFLASRDKTVFTRSARI